MKIARLCKKLVNWLLLLLPQLNNIVLVHSRGKAAPLGNFFDPRSGRAFLNPVPLAVRRAHIVTTSFPSLSWGCVSMGNEFGQFALSLLIWTVKGRFIGGEFGPSRDQGWTWTGWIWTRVNQYGTRHFLWSGYCKKGKISTNLVLFLVYRLVPATPHYQRLKMISTRLKNDIKEKKNMFLPPI